MTDPDYPTMWQGRPARIVPHAGDRHVDGLKGRLWEPFIARPGMVIEYRPQPGGHTFPGDDMSEEPTAEAEPSGTAQSAVAGDSRSPGADWTPPPAFGYMRALRDADDLTATEYRVLANMLTYADWDLTNARPGNSRLAQHVGCSVSSVSKHVRALHRKGYLRRTSPGTNYGGNHAATYTLTLPRR